MAAEVAAGLHVPVPELSQWRVRHVPERPGALNGQRIRYLVRDADGVEVVETCCEGTALALSERLGGTAEALFLAVTVSEVIADYRRAVVT